MLTNIFVTVSKNDIDGTDLSAEVALFIFATY